MEFQHPFPITALTAVFAFVLFVYHFLHRSRSSQARKKKLAPEAAGGWPLIGHLHMLGGPELPHIVLGTLADKYGPIFAVRLGLHRALVLSDRDMAKECFTTNDLAFSTRPQVIAVELMGYNNAMFGFASYGSYWRELRKIATIELLSSHRLSTFNHVRESEVKSSINKLYDSWKKNNKTDNNEVVVVDMKRWFGQLTMNVISRIILGKRENEMDDMSSEGDQWHRATQKFFELTGVFVVGDALPFLRWLDIGGHEKTMKKTAMELDLVLQGCLDEHKKRKDEKDFMGVMLSILGDNVAGQFDIDADIINKATCLALILGGSDTTMATLTWALSFLVNNPHTLKKAQEEVDKHVGKERRVKESDIKNLVYIQAIIKETLRLRPPAMLSPPREAMEDCVVGGYHVPAGTRLFLNLWKIHRDPRYWPDPLEFRPERFLTIQKDVDVRGQHFELLPFGSGRRLCPGISFAFQITELTLASFLHGFEMVNPSAEPIDMTPSFGFTNHKATPLEVLLSPRLSADLY